MADDQPEDAGSAAPDPPEGAREDGPGDEDGERGPLSDLAADVSRRRSDREESGDLFEEAFDEVDVDDVDVEDVWAELDAESAESEDAGGEFDRADESEVRVQHKNVCHGCEYFGTPPEMHCTHEGTEIREVADADHYEVSDCPMMVSEDFE